MPRLYIDLLTKFQPLYNTSPPPTTYANHHPGLGIHDELHTKSFPTAPHADWSSVALAPTRSAVATCADFGCMRAHVRATRPPMQQNAAERTLALGFVTNRVSKVVSPMVHGKWTGSPLTGRKGRQECQEASGTDNARGDDSSRIQAM